MRDTHPARAVLINKIEKIKGYYKKEPDRNSAVIAEAGRFFFCVLPFDQMIRNPAINVTIGMVTIERTVEKANISDAYV